MAGRLQAGRTHSYITGLSAHRKEDAKVGTPLDLKTEIQFSVGYLAPNRVMVKTNAKVGESSDLLSLTVQTVTTFSLLQKAEKEQVDAEKSMFAQHGYRYLSMIVATLTHHMALTSPLVLPPFEDLGAAQWEESEEEVSETEVD